MSYASRLIELRLRAERDDLMKANALLHALIGNREVEIVRLRAALKEIQDNGYRAALCHAVAKTALEQIPMTLRELPQKEAAAEIDEAEKNAEIERLRAVLMQIAHGRRDNGRPLAAEMARQKAREALPEGNW
jgi:hypothetical protein